AFEISVNKTRVKLSHELREQLKDHVVRLTVLAKTVYSRKEGVSGGRPAGGTGGTTPAGDGARPVTGTPPGTGNRSLPPATTGTSTTSRIRTALEAAAAQTNATEALQQIVSVIQRTQPEIARELGW